MSSATSNYQPEDDMSPTVNYDPDQDLSEEMTGTWKLLHRSEWKQIQDRLQRVEEERDRLQAEIRAAREGHTELWEGIRDLPERDQDKECTSYLGNLMIRFDALLADLEPDAEDDG